MIGNKFASKKMKVTLLMSVSFQLNIVAPLRVYFLILSYYICFKVYQDIFKKLTLSSLYIC